jgi:hypothetical protein
MGVRQLLAGATCAAIIGCWSIAWAQTGRPVRTFPEFTGTWVLDEAASTGPLVITPRIPSRMTISTTPSEITVAKRLRLDPRDRIADTPEPEVYRFDGTETTVNRRHFSFRLVADALVLTEKYTSINGSGSFTLTTDAFSVTGDVLTVHRQLSSITPDGHILVMQVPGNNFRHTYIYRREAPGNR